MFLGQRHSAIGIDLGGGSLKLVQFRTKGDPPRQSLLAAAKLNAPFPNNGQGAAERSAFAKDLKKLLTARKFGARRAVIALPPSDVDVRPLTLPVDDHDVAKKVRWEAESYLGCPAEEAIIDHIVLGEAKSAGERRLEVLAASVEKRKALSSLELLSHAGLITEAVDIIPIALCRLLQASQSEPDGASAAVDIGALITHAVIMNAGELRMVRSINIGGNTLTEAIRAALELSEQEAEVLKCQHGAGTADDADPDAEPPADTPEPEDSQKITHIINDILRDKLDNLAAELQKLFRYFSAQNQGRNVEQVFLVGGGGALKHLDTLLAARLHTQVEVGAPLSRITGHTVELKDGNEGSFAVAAGLALRKI